MALILGNGETLTPDEILGKAEQGDMFAKPKAKPLMDGLFDAPPGKTTQGEELQPNQKRVRSTQFYLGPRGGKWADPEHTVPWSGEGGAEPGQQTIQAPGAQDVTVSQHQQKAVRAIIERQTRAVTTYTRAAMEARDAGDKKTEAGAWAQAEKAARNVAAAYEHLGDTAMAEAHIQDAIRLANRKDAAFREAEGSKEDFHDWMNRQEESRKRARENSLAAKEGKLAEEPTWKPTRKPTKKDLARKVKKADAYAGLEDYMTKSKEQIPGGLAEGKKPGDFDQEQLKMGIKVEMEHTPDKAKAREIAMDHLTEDSKYYTHLAAMEAKHAKKSAYDALDDFAKGQPSATTSLTPEKARLMLHEHSGGHGRAITEQQRKFFGAIGGHLPAPGKKAKKSAKPAESPEEEERQEEEKEKRDEGKPPPLRKAGPYQGPRGGMWEDPEHTIPWKGDKKAPKKAKGVADLSVSQLAKKPQKWLDDQQEKVMRDLEQAMGVWRKLGSPDQPPKELKEGMANLNALRDKLSSAIKQKTMGKSMSGVDALFDYTRGIGTIQSVHGPQYSVDSDPHPGVVPEAARQTREFWKNNPRGIQDPEDLTKALYIGPKGGRWADAKHTIPYDEKKHGPGAKKGKAKGKAKRPKNTHVFLGDVGALINDFEKEHGKGWLNRHIFGRGIIDDFKGMLAASETKGRGDSRLHLDKKQARAFLKPLQEALKDVGKYGGVPGKVRAEKRALKDIVSELRYALKNPEPSLDAMRKYAAKRGKEYGDRLKAAIATGKAEHYRDAAAAAADVSSMLRDMGKRADAAEWSERTTQAMDAAHLADRQKPKATSLAKDKRDLSAALADLEVLRTGGTIEGSSPDAVIQKINGLAQSVATKLTARIEAAKKKSGGGPTRAIDKMLTERDRLENVEYAIRAAEKDLARRESKGTALPLKATGPAQALEVPPAPGSVVSSSFDVEFDGKKVLGTIIRSHAVGLAEAINEEAQRGLTAIEYEAAHQVARAAVNSYWQDLRVQGYTQLSRGSHQEEKMKALEQRATALSLLAAKARKLPGGRVIQYNEARDPGYHSEWTAGDHQEASDYYRGVIEELRGKGASPAYTKQASSMMSYHAEQAQQKGGAPAAPAPAEPTPTPAPDRAAKQAKQAAKRRLEKLKAAEDDFIAHGAPEDLFESLKEGETAMLSQGRRGYRMDVRRVGNQLISTHSDRVLYTDPAPAPAPDRAAQREVERREMADAADAPKVSKMSWTKKGRMVPTPTSTDDAAFILNALEPGGVVRVQLPYGGGFYAIRKTAGGSFDIQRASAVGGGKTPGFRPKPQEGLARKPADEARNIAEDYLTGDVWLKLIPAPRVRKSHKNLNEWLQTNEENDMSKAEMKIRRMGKSGLDELDEFAKGGFKYKRKRWVNGKWVYEYEDTKGNIVEAPEKGSPVDLLMEKHGPKIEKMLKELSDAVRQDQIDNDTRETKESGGTSSVFGALLGPTPKSDAVKKKYGELWKLWERATELETAMMDKSLIKGVPFIGPRGGKWADAKHTIPWDGGEGSGGGKKESAVTAGDLKIGELTSEQKQKREEAEKKRQEAIAAEKKKTPEQKAKERAEARRMLETMGRKKEAKPSEISKEKHKEIMGLLLAGKKEEAQKVFDDADEGEGSGGGKKKTKKSEVNEMSGIDALVSYGQEDEDLEKAQSMPEGGPKQKLGQGEEQGGKLAGVGMTSGSNNSGGGPGQDADGQVTGTKTGKDKLSEDEEEDEANMKPHKKPIETAKSMVMTPARQRDLTAQEHAQKVAELQKGEEDLVVEGTGLAEQGEELPELEKGREGVQGMVHYSEQSDLEAERLLKSEEFYSGGSPKVIPFSRPIGAGKVCLKCKTLLSKSLTACPNCGNGAVIHQVVPGGEAQGDHDGEPIVKSQAGKLRAPVVKDVKFD